MKRNRARDGAWHGVLSAKRRGVALLLVMVGLVVCTLLTAGFLSTQGTSIAIARNERDAEQSRMLAQAGIDLCFAQIRALDAARTSADQPGWREKMVPGTWLSNYPIGKGTVTVAAHSAGASDSFTADYHQPVVLTSTGYANNRQFTLTATIGPTGGGEVFRGGNFFVNTVVIGSGGLPLLAPTATVDSYNSGSGPYSTSDHKAVVWTNLTGSNSVTIQTDSVLDGSVLAGPTSLLTGVVNLLGSLLGGNSSVASATEARDPGIVIPPNIAGLTSLGSPSPTNGPLTPGMYDNVTIMSHLPSYVIFSPGFYAIKGSLNLPSSAKINVGAGNTVIYVGGNLTLTGSSIAVATGGTLTIYVGGSVNLSSAVISSSASNPLPAQVEILGLASAGSIQLSGSSKIVGAIYSPKSSVLLQSGSPVIQGAVIAHDLTLLNTSQLHYDEATKSIRVSNIAGGTAPPGAADYTVAETAVR
jgi:hypothetical protein